MKKKTMRTLCILAAVSQISLICMILCDYITIGVESRKEGPEKTVEGNSIKDKVKRMDKVNKVTKYDVEKVEGKEKATMVDALGNTNPQHETADSELSKVSGVKGHKLFNNLVDGKKNNEEEKNPPSTARWCREVWENFSPEVDVAPYSDISGSVSSSYESSDGD